MRTCRRSTCDACRKAADSIRRDTTLGELAKSIDDQGIHPSWRWSEVRYDCRRVNGNRPRVCQHCGYDVHVEFAHVKALSMWPADATLTQVNDPSNVLVLCPNHHWEFDNGKLSLDEVLRPRQESNLHDPVTLSTP